MLIDSFVVYHREKPIIKRSQYQFLVTMLLGGVLMCYAAVMYSGSPSHVVCALRPAMVSMAFTLIFGSLVVKSMRVYRVFLSSSLKRVVLSAGTMMKVLATFLVVDIVILLMWELVSPSKATFKAEMVAEIGGLEVDRLYCESSSSIFVGLLFFWKAVMLFGGLYLSILIRKVSSDFQESVWIFASAVVVLFSSLLLLPMGYLVTLAASVFFLFFTFILLSATSLVIGLMLVPKILCLHEIASEAKNSRPTTKSKRTRDKGHSSESEDGMQVTPLRSRGRSKSSRSSRNEGGATKQYDETVKKDRGNKKDKNGIKKDGIRVSVPVSMKKFSAKVGVNIQPLGVELQLGGSVAMARREKSTLSYRVFEDSSSGKEPTKTALVMHGILGNKLNWRTFSQKLTKANPNWRFICLDLRGHGDSPSFSEPHNLEACANDVFKLAAHLKVEPTAVLGHSFGGKVALTYLQQCMKQSRALPSQVWILDSLPGTGETDYASRDLTNSIETILPVVKQIPLPIQSKAQLIKDLQAKGVALGEAQWLTTNLRLTSKSPELYEWKMDVDVIEQLFRSFLTTDLWPVVEDPPASEGKDVEIHFVHADRNNMWTPDLLDRLDAQVENQVYHHLLQKSGHWVHIDNPVGLMQIIQSNMLE
ncbi:hypothetical protein BBO99_00003976 [Phytophthora kernoviae]|uniref:G-protein coupled receptors family 3 profile domain-containing protein n=1 Tax=Phytophthora kernoviae TaxID=325452 RepID=A0A3R7KKM5_9STRA|nr:hypothetical protein BBI17_004013 [Phytophthora kernoviae]RLN81100.1 hypothetical protein BBO99_00003976 [Phytophthora kernoviae]